MEIKKVWRRGAASTMELARVVCAARTQSRYGQWAQLWKSGSLPFSKRKGDVLVAIGRRWGTADEQTYARLPIGWNILYHLARLEPTLFDRLLEEGTIRPAMTLREAKELLARFQGGKSARSQKTKIKEYLRRLARFIASRRDWQTEERVMIIEALTRHVEEMRGASDPVLDRNGSSSILMPRSPSSKSSSRPCCALPGVGR